MRSAVRSEGLHSPHMPIRIAVSGSNSLTDERNVRVPGLSAAARRDTSARREGKREKEDSTLDVPGYAALSLHAHTSYRTERSAEGSEPSEHRQCP